VRARARHGLSFPQLRAQRRSARGRSNPEASRFAGALQDVRREPYASSAGRGLSGREWRRRASESIGRCRGSRHGGA
jgi:hypothetical protein